MTTHYSEATRDDEIPIDTDESASEWVRVQPHEIRTPNASPNVAPGDGAPPYLSHQASTDVRERWQALQASFVDDPRRSVAEAHQLVDHLMQRIVDSFAQERASLERQWASGDQVSTEELRVCLQRYRAFFARLLPAVPES